MKFLMTVLLPESADTVIPTHSSNNCHMMPHKVQKLIIKSLEQALEELCYYGIRNRINHKQFRSIFPGSLITIMVFGVPLGAINDRESIL